MKEKLITVKRAEDMLDIEEVEKPIVSGRTGHSGDTWTPAQVYWRYSVGVVGEPWNKCQEYS